MAEVKWIKVSTEMFSSNRKIKQIELMPEGDTILVIWLKLLLLAGNINDGGAIYLTPEIPYTEEMLANELRRPINTVRMALSLFERFGMIEIIDDILHLSSWQKYQNIEGMEKIREQNRARQKKWYDKQKALPNGTVTQPNVRSNVTVTQPNDTEEEKEEDLDLDKEYSFNHSVENGVSDVENFPSKESAKREILGGSLGRDVVMLSEDQRHDLLERLSLDEFHHYISVIADQELKGRHYKRKTHYQAILEMATKDRKLR